MSTLSKSFCLAVTSINMKRFSKYPNFTKQRNEIILDTNKLIKHVYRHVANSKVCDF